MEYIALGKSDLMASRTAFGAMSLKDFEDPENAVKLVREAYEAGINFFDTSHSTVESEKRLGDCLFGIRQDVILSTKSNAQSGSLLNSELEESLSNLHTDHIDIFHFETEKFVPKKNGIDGIYKSLEIIKKTGKARHIGLTTQNAEAAFEALNDENSIFEVLQYPFNVLTDENSKKIVKLCEEKDVGFIAMRPLYSGLIQNIRLAVGFLSSYENVVPVWGVRESAELQEILYYAAHPPVIDEKFNAELEELCKFFN